MNNKEFNGLPPVEVVVVRDVFELKDFTYSEEVVKDILTDYFIGYLESVKLKFSEDRFEFSAERGDKKYSYNFDARKWDADQKDGLLYRWLENIKAEILKGK